MKIGFDIDAFAGQYLPPILRTPIRQAWLCSLLAPLRAMWGQYDAYRTEARYAAAVTGQKIVLEAYLNRLFDPLEKRIYLRTGSDFGVWVAYDPAHDQGGQFVSDGMAIGSKNQKDTAFGYDFIVEVPPGVDTEAVRTVVKKYAVIGAKFDVNINQAMVALKYRLTK